MKLILWEMLVKKLTINCAIDMSQLDMSQLGTVETLCNEADTVGKLCNEVETVGTLYNEADTEGGLYDNVEVGKDSIASV